MCCWAGRSVWWQPRSIARHFQARASGTLKLRKSLTKPIATNSCLNLVASANEGCEDPSPPPPTPLGSVGNNFDLMQRGIRSKLKRPLLSDATGPITEAYIWGNYNFLVFFLHVSPIEEHFCFIVAESQKTLINPIYTPRGLRTMHWKKPVFAYLQMWNSKLFWSIYPALGM
jgi:hypothetical protein